MDYSNMKATKTKRQPLDADINISRSSTRKVKKSMKRLKINWLIVALFLVIGGIGGFFAHMFLIPNDTYHMVAYENGQSDIYIGINEDTKTYTELGVKCVAFGKDCSSDCTVKYFYRADLTENEVEVEKVDETKSGIYYAVYTASSFKYKSVKLIRNIFVTGGEDNG